MLHPKYDQLPVLLQYYPDLYHIEPTKKTKYYLDHPHTKSDGFRHWAIKYTLRLVVSKLWP